MNHGNKKGDWIKKATAEEIQNHIEKLEQNISSCQSKIEWYKQEQERRKQEVPLGVPTAVKNKMFFFLNSFNEVTFPSTLYSIQDDIKLQDCCNVFDSIESAEKHAKMLLAWRKALVANSKGEPIDIKVLLPLLPKGWAAMDENGDWFWHKEKPEVCGGSWRISSRYYYIPPCFRLKPAEDWRESLMECGL